MKFLTKREQILKKLNDVIDSQTLLGSLIRRAYSERDKEMDKMFGSISKVLEIQNDITSLTQTQNHLNEYYDYLRNVLEIEEKLEEKNDRSER